MLKEFYVRGKKVELPIFLPDATHGFVKGVSTQDLVTCGIKGLVINTYHLFRDGLVGDIKKKKGIGNYMELPSNMLSLSDSGGFQVFSIIHESKDKELGYLNDNGATFTFDNKKVELTPEKCIQIQMDIGADIIMCLDDCTSPEMSGEEQEISVKRTIDWAKRCKKEYERLIMDIPEDKKPLIFGIIQGGKNLELRKKCADELIKIDFDGYAFGGWPAEDGKFMHELLKYTAELMPDDKPKYAMGIGKPEDIVYCVKVGYNMFDCVIPTREARNNRLYAFRSRLFGFGRYPLKPHESGNFYKFVRVRNAKYKDEKKPISKHCDIECCTENSCSDIYKLFRNKNKESIRLATMHNLRFYTMLMEMLKDSKL